MEPAITFRGGPHDGQRMIFPMGALGQVMLPDGERQGHFHVYNETVEVGDNEMRSVFVYQGMASPQDLGAPPQPDQQ